MKKRTANTRKTISKIPQDYKPISSEPILSSSCLDVSFSLQAITDQREKGYYTGLIIQSSDPGGYLMNDKEIISGGEKFIVNKTATIKENDFVYYKLKKDEEKIAHFGIFKGKQQGRILIHDSEIKKFFPLDIDILYRVEAAIRIEWFN